MSAKASAVAGVAGGRSEPDAAVAHYLAEQARVRGALPGAGTAWLRDLREWGLARFAELGFPGPRDEQWKYTRTAAVAARSFRLSEAVPTPPRDALDPFLIPGLDPYRLVFVNGRYSAELSDTGGLPAGVEMSSLAEVLASSPDRARSWVSSTPVRSGFDALNQAFLADGAWLEVPPGVALERPVQLIYLSVGSDPPTLANVRNVLVLGVNAQAKVIESYGAAGAAAGLTNAVTTVGLADGASLEHYKLQEESEKAFHVARLDVRQARDSRFTSHSVSLGGELTRNDIGAALEAEGAECTLNGLYMVDGRQHVDFHTSVEHTQPRGTSREFYKGILGGRARGVFNGRIHVHPGAQKTDSQQSNQNLLLSRDAEVDTKPELEIYADDVKCSHGATVGQLDPDMLFYLRSRGIDPDSARGLLTYGFAQDVIERMSLEAVRERLERLIVTRVPDAERVRAMV